MKEITKCPSTLALGYSAYSPIAIKRLFDGKKVSPYLGFEIEEILLVPHGGWHNDTIVTVERKQ